MSTRDGARGAPLSVYLVALIAIPVIAVVVVAAVSVRDDRARARTAEAVADAVTAETVALGVIAPLEAERIAALTVVRAGGAEVPDAVTSELDRALGDFGALVDSFDVGDGPDLRDELDEATAGVAAARVAAPTASMSLARTDAAYDSMVGVVAAFVATNEQMFAARQPDVFEASQILSDQRAGRELVLSAAQEVDQLADVLAGDEPLDAAELVSQRVRHRRAIALAASRLEAVAIDELTTAYEAVSSSVDRWLQEIAPTSDGRPVEPSVADAAAGFIADQFVYLGLVDEVRSSTSDRLVAAADDAAAAENDDARRSLMLLLAVVLGVIVIAVVVWRALVRPLGLLRRHAQLVSDGELPGEPIPLTGPRDIRGVSAAMNDMSATIAAADEELVALAAGDSFDDRRAPALPGAVGDAIGASFERVAELTADLRRSQERLEFEARHDRLTGLTNRFGALEYLDRILADANDQTAVMIVDLDGFKGVNDTNGQAVGDGVLLEVAERIAATAGGRDFVARIGGDAFLVIGRDCHDAVAAVELGERILAAIQVPYRVGQLHLPLSASVGLRLVDPRADALGAVERADAAVFHAKRRGRGRVEMYDADLQREIAEDTEIELALRNGVEDGQLRLFLQPTAELSTGRVDGAEALVRWERPGIGMATPGRFIPVAERSGLIIDIDRWVLMEAGRLIAEWKQRDPDCALRLAVNVSGRHLGEGDLIADIDRVIDVTGADPNLLELELTESHLLDDVERVGSILDALRGRGVGLAIDDFGTGYSSMTYLQQLPLDVIKIDRSFVERAPAETFDSVVIESVVRLGDALSLETLAEGLETFEQLAVVRSLGVHRAQGYVLARPMPVPEVEPILFGGRLIDPAVLDRYAPSVTG